ncbi:Rv3235 family protein [Pseudonocardia xinjiangensis]|uniref:Rv3235 family protein n=1 Tax=Pseudonocardia xinjiangensis TaxID=75289 RepID=UPI003D90DA74
MTTTLAATPPPPGPATGTATRPRLRRMTYEPGPGATGAVATLPLPRPPAPVVTTATPAETAHAHRSTGRILRLALEVLDGRRPPAQLTGHMTAPVLRYWRAATQQRTVRSPARFTRMRLCLPQPGVAEVAVACAMDGRVRALAARFERTDDPGSGWRCTALRLG